MINHEAEVLVLADDERDPIWKIEFQRALGSVDDEAYCVVLPSGATAYDCLDSVSVTKTHMRLTLLPEVASAVGAKGEIEIALELAPQEFALMSVCFRGIVVESHKPPQVDGLDGF